MDRNQSARNEFAAAQQRAAFARQLQAGTVNVLDRLAAPIRKGDLVIWQPPFDLVFNVLDVGPNLDPNVPPGVVRVVLQATVPLDVPAGQPQMKMIRVGSEKEPGHAQLDEIKPVEPPAPVALTDAPVVEEPPLDPAIN